MEVCYYQSFQLPAQLLREITEAQMRSYKVGDCSFLTQFLRVLEEPQLQDHVY